MTYVSNINFGSYLAGLWEGDGHLSMPRPKDRYNPRWCITFHSRDVALAEVLKRKLGGFIRHKVKNNACVLVVSTVPGLKAVLKTTHGQYRSPKLRSVNRLITWLNTHHNANLPYETELKTSLRTNAWLAGFIDADGSFGVRFTRQTASQKCRISCRFRLEQRMVDPVSSESYQALMLSLTQMLDVNLKKRKQNTGRSYFLVESSSIQSNTKLVSYLNHYNLFSSKKHNYDLWCRVHAKLKFKLAYVEPYIKEIEIIKLNINKNPEICIQNLKKL